MNQSRNQEQLQAALQHTPLPERMGSFERTIGPLAPRVQEDGTWVIVEYRHVSEDVRFQVVMEDGMVRFQVWQEGAANRLNAMPLEEAGHVLRADLLMILEDIEDEL